LFKAGPVVTVQHDEHITRVFLKLITEGFLSAPVLDDHRKFMGFIDLLDVVSYSVHLFEQEKLDWNPANWEAFWARLTTFREARVKDVMSNIDWVRPNALHAIKRGFSLLHAMELMAREGVHRVAVLDEADHVVGISTQSMIVSLVSQNIKLLGSTKDRPVSDCHSHLCDEVLAVKESQRAIDAFRLMANKRVNGLAVLNDSGFIVDVISVRDIRGMGTDGAKWWRLFEPVSSYKALTRAAFPQQTPRRPLYVTANDTLERVIHLMDDGNIHRVFEVIPIKDTSDTSVAPRPFGGLPSPLKPHHVIAQRDVIRYILTLFGMPSGIRPAISGISSSSSDVGPTSVGNMTGKLVHFEMASHTLLHQSPAGLSILTETETETTPATSGALP